MHPLPEHLLARPIPGLPDVEDLRGPLYAVIASLALGGAERIVLEWAAEAIARMAMSLVLTPSALLDADDPQAVAAFARETLLPMLRPRA